MTALAITTLAVLALVSVVASFVLVSRGDLTSDRRLRRMREVRQAERRLRTLADEAMAAMSDVARSQDRRGRL